MEPHLTDIAYILAFSSLAFLVTIAMIPAYIGLLKKLELRQQIRESAMSGEKASLFAALHKHKAGTPTMGGAVIWGATILMVCLSMLLPFFDLTTFSLWNRNETYIPLFTLVTCGLLGMVDDLFNIFGIGTHKGLRVTPKMVWLTIFAAASAWWFYAKLGCLDDAINACMIHVPLMGTMDIGWLYVPLFILVIISSANAVNFTDGLDGLVGGLLILAFSAFGIISFAQGLLLLATLCATIVGALTAFLWFNIPPARFFMGDTGSLALGATLGVIAMLTDSLVPFLFISVVFIGETLSVIIQLTSKKLLHRKVFLIAPIHHHFEKLGWPEHQVTMRFWIIGGMGAALGVVLALSGL